MVSPGRRGFLAGGGALLLSGCASGRLLDGGATGFDWGPIPEPETVGVSRAGIEGVRTTVRKFVDDHEMHGAVGAIIRNNKVVWHEAIGSRDPLTGDAMRTDDIFRIMSASKPITAVAVLVMMDQGRLTLDDKVSRFLPTFVNPQVAVAPAGATQASQVRLEPADREITIRDLLTHTSGLTSVGDTIAPGVGALVNRIERTADDTLETYVPKLGGAALDFQPGTRWAYSATDGMDTLLRIVEITSGQRADIFLQERLFQPLGMRDTFFNVPAEKRHRLVDIWGYEDGAWTRKPHLFGEGPWRYFSGGGGLFSTLSDRLTIDLMLQNQGAFNGRRILSAEAVSEMTRNQVGDLFAQWIPPMTRDYGFGLGVRVATGPENINGRSVGGFGWGGAYGTDSWAEPERQLVAGLFTQMQPLSFMAGAQFERAVHQALI